jgi:hypothetical protein
VRAQSTRSQISAGWSPKASEYTTPACAALRASSGPQKASASTVTLTTCLPWAKASRHVVDGGHRVAGAFDDHVDLPGGATSACQSSPIQVVPSRTAASIDPALGRLGFPADAGQVGAGALRREVGDAHQMHAGGARYLGQVHGAELAGPDQADAHRAPFGGALLEFAVEVHGRKDTACRVSDSTPRAIA